MLFNSPPYHITIHTTLFQLVVKRSHFLTAHGARLGVADHKSQKRPFEEMVLPVWAILWTIGKIHTS